MSKEKQRTDILSVQLIVKGKKLDLTKKEFVALRDLMAEPFSNELDFLTEPMQMDQSGVLGERYVKF